MTWPSVSAAGSNTGQILIDVASFVERIGAPDLSAGNAEPGLAIPSQNPEELWACLERCRACVLAEREWPGVIQAWQLAHQGQARELVALDVDWGRRFSSAPFAEASFRVGQRQLSRLRALRDNRVVQRYLAAVTSGDAHGWHPLVYGTVLAVFQIPLRQGLVQFGAQTLVGYARAANRAMAVPEAAADRLLAQQVELLPGCLPPLPFEEAFNIR